MIKIESQVREFKIDPYVAKIKAGLVRANAVYLELQTNRLNQGYDVHGNFFKPYSPGYAKLKAEWQSGKNTWMRVSGGLMRSQKYVLTSSGTIHRLTVFFSGSYSPGKLERNKKKKVVMHRGPQQQASFLASRNNQIRPFVGVRPQDVSVIQRAIFQK